MSACSSVITIGSIEVHCSLDSYPTGRVVNHITGEREGIHAHANGSYFHEARIREDDRVSGADSVTLLWR